MADQPAAQPADGRSWVADHLKAYLGSDGADGHILDMTALGGRADQKTLLLRTVGRRSGQVLIHPLIYEKVGEDYVIVASKGGAPDHPAWFLNLTAEPQTRFQAGRDHFRGTWRIAEGEERARIWQHMVEAYPPYADYQKKTSRQIPVVLLRPAEKTASL
jgi:deazaflavin-dependent oxidoreductase (nitroreductase family)